MMLFMLALVVVGATGDEENQHRQNFHSKLGSLPRPSGSYESKAVVVGPTEATVQVGTFAELEAAITSATTVPTTVEVLSDLMMETITIEADQTIVLTGDGVTLEAQGRQHFVVLGTAMMENFYFTGGTGLNGGSILVTDGGSCKVVNSTFTENRAGYLPTAFPTVAPSISKLPSPAPSALPTIAPSISAAPTPYLATRTLKGNFSCPEDLSSGRSAPDCSFVLFDTSIFAESIASAKLSLQVIGNFYDYTGEDTFGGSTSALIITKSGVIL